MIHVVLPYIGFSRNSNLPVHDIQGSVGLLLGPGVEPLVVESKEGTTSSINWKGQ